MNIDEGFLEVRRVCVVHVDEVFVDDRYIGTVFKLRSGEWAYAYSFEDSLGPLDGTRRRKTKAEAVHALRKADHTNMSVTTVHRGIKDDELVRRAVMNSKHRLGLYRGVMETFHIEGGVAVALCRRYDLDPYEELETDDE